MLSKTLQTVSIFALVLFGLAGCEYNTGLYGRYYHQAPGVTVRYPITPLERVQMVTCDYGAIRDNIARLRAKGYLAIGESNFEASSQDPLQARILAAVAGGDLVLVSKRFEREAEGSRMVVGSYTPGRVITGNSSTYGRASYYGDLSGTANYYGTTDSSVYVPSSTTYVRENYTYERYAQSAVVFASPSRIAEIEAKNKKGRTP